MAPVVARELLSGALASGYHGPPELTAVTAFTQWYFDPWALAALLLLGAGYLGGVRRVRRAGIDWPVRRVVAFCVGGLGLGVIATSSSVAAYWSVLFYMRAGQTVLLLLGIPMFLTMGRPLTLAIAASPRWGPRIEAAATGRIARVLTFPAITAGLMVVMPFVLYFSPWYAAGLHSFAVRESTALILLVPGLLFFWTLLRFDPVPRPYPYVVALWVSAVEVIGDAILGLAVIADQNLIARGYYYGLHRPWGPTVRFDQMLGGGTLWVLGDIIGLPFLAAMLIGMIHEDERHARAIDAQLDAEDAAAARQAPARPAADQQVTADGQVTAESGEAGPGLWWQQDPRFAGRFSPVDPPARDG
jgi:cytochrome c oxidase assembly factor CtaG